jgi:hypothetical protein
MDGDSTNNSGSTGDNNSNSNGNGEYVLLGGKFKVSKKLYDHLVASGSWEPGKNDIIVLGTSKTSDEENQDDIIVVDKNTSFRIVRYDYVHGSNIKTTKEFSVGFTFTSIVTLPLYAAGVPGLVVTAGNFLGGLAYAQMEDFEKNMLSKFKNYTGIGYKIILEKKEVRFFRTKISKQIFYYNQYIEFITNTSSTQINYIRP